MSGGLDYTAVGQHTGRIQKRAEADTKGSAHLTCERYEPSPGLR